MNAIFKSEFKINVVKIKMTYKINHSNFKQHKFDNTICKITNKVRSLKKLCNHLNRSENNISSKYTKGFWHTIAKYICTK